MILDLARLAADPLRYRNWEEAWSATEGLWLREGHLWSQLLAMQYKEFCGGCTVLAASWAPWSALFGDGFLAWKALALLRSAVVIGLAFWAMDGWFGRASAFAAALLLALVPTGHADLSLMLWANHVDAAVPVLLALALAAPGRERALWAGLVLGLGVWAGRTTLYGAVIVPWLMMRDPKVLVGFVLGLAPILLPAAAGDGGDYRFLPGLSAELPSAALHRLSLLLDPRELGVRLMPARPSLALWSVTTLAAAGLGLWRAGSRRWVLIALMSSFVLAFSLSPVPIPDIGPEALPLNARFFAPWMLLLPLAAAAGAGGRVGAAVVGLGLAAGLVSQVDSLLRSNMAESPAMSAVDATDFGRFAVMIAPRLPVEELCDAWAKNVAVQHGLSRACGVQLGLEVLAGERSLAGAMERATAAASPDGALWGLGLALGDAYEIVQLNTLTSGQPAALASGVAQAMGLRLARLSAGPFARDKTHRAPPPDPRRRVRAELDWLRTSLPDEAPCLLCAAAGEGAAESCGAFGPRVPQELELCLAESIRQAGEDGPALAFGAGLALARRRDLALGESLSAALGEDFARGFHHPAAGLDVPARQ